MNTPEAINALRIVLRLNLQHSEKEPGCFSGTKVLCGRHGAFELEPTAKVLGAIGKQAGLPPEPLVQLAVVQLTPDEETTAIRDGLAWLDKLELRLAVPEYTPPAIGGADATETVDTFGYVTNPMDPTAYVAATDALRNHTPAALATTYKQFRAILDKHPEIRRWQVRKNRLSVHLAEWTVYVQEETSPVDADGLLADQFEVEARKEEIRRKNKTRK